MASDTATRGTRTVRPTRSPKTTSLTRASARSHARRALALAALVWVAACGGPEKRPESPIDAEFARLESSARGAFARGELAYARDLYTDLLVAAERTDDARKIGDTAFNAAVCRLALGELDAARELLTLAEHELARAGESQASVFVARARLELADGRPVAARDAATRALEADGARADAREASEAHLVRGLAALALGEVEAARDEWAAMEGLSDAPESEPGRLRLEARLLAADGRHGEAAEAFEAEAASARELSRYGAMALALERAGDQRLADGAPAAAGELWLRAARSRFALATSRGATPAEELDELAAAARLCSRIGETGGLEADPGLAARLVPLVRRIDEERTRLEGLVALEEARRRALEESEVRSTNPPTDSMPE